MSLWRKTAAFALLALLLAAPAAAEETIDLTLPQGERWTIPAGRLGDAAISDEAVVALEDGQLVGLKPGRAEVRLTGGEETLIRVLVLFADPERSAAPSPAPQAATDYRYYAVSDFDDDDDTDEPAEDAMEDDLPDAPAGQPADADEDVPAEAPEGVDEEPSEDEPENAAEDETAATAPETEAEREAESEPTDIRTQDYDRTAVPEAINTVIDFALNEWRVADNKTFSRAGSKNKYSYWQCGKGPKCDIGWCGAFLGYVFDTCGIPMDEPTKSVPHESGEPYSVRAAGVGKINKGFDKMERLSMTPRPGYLVVYGEQKAYGYKHIGLVTDVDDLGGGRYLLKTVEGNMSNRIKRYCYVFDSNEAVKNTQPCPEEYRLADGEINDYEHIKKWNITTFCQTWFD